MFPGRMTNSGSASPTEPNAAESAVVPVPPTEPTSAEAVPELPTESFITVAARTALRFVTIGLLLGVFVSLLTVPDLAAFATSNALTPALRRRSLVIILVMLLLTVVGPAIYGLVRRSRTKLDRLDALSDGLMPLAWLWPLPLFFDWKVYGGVGLVRVVMAGIWAVGLERSLRSGFTYWSPRLSPRLSRLPRLSEVWKGRLAAVTVLLMVTGFASFTAYFSILQHHKLSTAGFDLGLFDNLYFNLKQGEWFRATVDRGNGNGAHIQYHANFLAYLWLPIYALKPCSETLLAIQGVMVGLAGIPFALLARRRLDSALVGVLFCYLFLIHEGVLGPVFFDFHFLTLSPFFVGWTLYLFDAGKTKSLIFVWILTLLLREDQGAVIGGAALVYLLSGKRPGWALVMGLVGGAWLALMRFVVMPMHADHGFQQHIGIFQGMVAQGDKGFGGVLKTIITNPSYTLNNFLELRKFEYVLALGVPFLLLPFRRLRLLLLFVPATLFTLVSTNYGPAVNTRFQYSMYWMPGMILGTLMVLSEWRNEPNGKNRVRAALCAIFIVATALSYGAGGFFQQNTLIGGFRKVSFELTKRDQQRLSTLRGLSGMIPQDASVTASESVVPHISNRRSAYTLRQGVGDSDYLLLRNEECRGGEQGNALIEGVKTGLYGVVKTDNGFQLWKRNAPTSGNARAMSSLGLRLPPAPRQ